MKKFLALASVVAVVGVVGTASAMDRSGKFGLGIQESFTDTFTSARLGTWSLKYGINSDITAQFLIGFDFGNKTTNSDINFGARALYNVVKHDNSNFYTGLGVGWNQDKAGNVAGDARILRINIPLGWEFSFNGLPEVGFSMEAGLDYDYVKAGKASIISSVGGKVGGNLGLGVHYYF